MSNVDRKYAWHPSTLHSNCIAGTPHGGRQIEEEANADSLFLGHDSANEATRESIENHDSPTATECFHLATLLVRLILGLFAPRYLHPIVLEA